VSLDSACLHAVERAKAATPEGEPLLCERLMAALYELEEIRGRYPGLEEKLPPLEAIRDAKTIKIPVSEELRPILTEALRSTTAMGPLALWERLCATPTGLALLGGCPAENDETRSGSWRTSSERREAVRALSSFGRFLTEMDLSKRRLSGREKEMSALVRTLSKMKRRNVLLVGAPGTGKSAMVYYLARRIQERDASLPEHLRDCDIFELSTSFLRAGASMVGQYEERVKALLTVLKEYPKIILFIDEVHAFFQSGMHYHGPFSDANEAFKAELGRGEICVIGCTTLNEYRHYIVPDGALERRFTVITLQPPSREETLDVLRVKRPMYEKYHGVTIPEEILPKVVELTDDYLLQRYQPDKSIQLLDTACAFARTSQPPSAQVDEAHLIQALEEISGHRYSVCRTIGEDDVRQTLSQRILGQDAVLRELARAFVSGLGRFRKRSATRGVFLFAGPTGTGKTMTAVELSKILGERCLLRVDCNTLGGSVHDPGPAINRLLGVDKGYVGYARGEGGLLSKVQDMPEGVVLFDEIEKAPPGVFNILLQMLDEGKVQDTDGNILDFRRSFIVFTTNAGCTYDGERRPTGFGAEMTAGRRAIKLTKESVFEGLRRRGCPEEFLGRFTHVFLFEPLDDKIGKDILRQGLEELTHLVERYGFQLEVDNTVVDHVLRLWNPRFGARHALTILKNRVIEHLGVADAQGELDGTTRIRLCLWLGDVKDVLGGAVRKKNGDVLEIAVV